MSTTLSSYLRRERRGWGLTQKELAKLLGMNSRTHVSKIEHGKRKPSVEFLIASLVLFGASIEDLYPSLYSHIEEEVLREASTLLETLAGNGSPKAARKRELLDAALRRAITRSSL